MWPLTWLVHAYEHSSTRSPCSGTTALLFLGLKGLGRAVQRLTRDVQQKRPFGRLALLRNFFRLL